MSYHSYLIIEIDDSKELDSFITLLDATTPKNIKIYNTVMFPNMHTLKEKPILITKVFKINFLNGKSEDLSSVQKHQILSMELNEVYAKVILYIKQSLFDDDNSDLFTMTNQPSAKFLKKRTKREEMKKVVIEVNFL